MTRNYRVLIDCRDEKGLVYKISKTLYDFDLNVEKNREFVDAHNGKFFMRSEVSGTFEPEALRVALQGILPEGAGIRIVAPRKKRIVLMATKESHCLGDILIRHEAGELEAQIVGVVSNYDHLQSLVERFEIPYVHVSHEGLTRPQHEAEILKALEPFEPLDYIVLAKYMRILTPEFVARFEERIINIHHSFLPAFIGANPYKQAYDRGVKIIGATAHFVNNNLDEGPIIAQNTIPVNHAMDWEQMRNAGRDVEKIVLARALKLALEDRIFVYANKTVVESVDAELREIPLEEARKFDGSAQLGEIFQIDITKQFLNGLGAHQRPEFVAVLLHRFVIHFFGQQRAFFQRRHARINNDKRFEIQHSLNFAHGHVQHQAQTRRQRLQEPDVRYRRSQVDVTHALAAHLGLGNFHAAFFTNDAAVFETLVFAAQALVIAYRTKQLGAKQAVTLRFERAIVDGFRFFDLAKGPGTDLFRRSDAYPDRVEIVRLVLLIE